MKTSDRSKNLICAPMILIVAIVSLTFVFAGCNRTESDSKIIPTNSETRPTENPNSEVPEIENAIPEIHENPKENTLLAVNPKERSIAEVIAKNVNLRALPSSTAAVLNVLPMGAEISVAKQQGSWFLVDYVGGKGWIHGNTIRIKTDFNGLDSKSDPAGRNLKGAKSQLNDSSSSRQSRRLRIGGGVYHGIGNGHWIQENINSGELLILEDGTLWKIDPLDVIVSILWLPLSDIIVKESSSGSVGYDYLLINTDDREMVHAKYLGNR